MIFLPRSITATSVLVSMPPPRACESERQRNKTCVRRKQAGIADNLEELIDAGATYLKAKGCDIRAKEYPCDEFGPQASNCEVAEGKGPTACLVIYLGCREVDTTRV